MKNRNAKEFVNLLKGKWYCCKVEKQKNSDGILQMWPSWQFSQIIKLLKTFEQAIGQSDATFMSSFEMVLKDKEYVDII